MDAIILKLKQLAASYLAALEYDYCPESDADLIEVRDLVTTTLTDKQLKDAFNENSGRTPHELARELAEFIESDLK